MPTATESVSWRSEPVILGLRTACYAVTDIARGRAWCSSVLGQTPYFDEPFYVGFNVGGFELGLVPDGQPGSAGVQVYWGVTGIHGVVRCAAPFAALD